MNIKKGYLFTKVDGFLDYFCDMHENCSDCPLNHPIDDYCLRHDYFEAHNYVKAMSDGFWCKEGELVSTVDKAFQAQADICATIKKRCKSKGYKVIFNDDGTVWFTKPEEKE